ncbi:MAG: glutamate--tRNA ligase, partial [Propionibacteriaceae bacterium]|nr:glutamate--tRNA ligase [Propionibacteriaceae bacterium]
MSLFNLAYARLTGGQFILRIEDTDRARYVEGSEAQIFDTLTWLGLTWDEGPDIGGPCAPYRQSERLDTYQPFVEQLIAAGHAYYCWCSPERLAAMRKAQEEAKQPTTGYDRMCCGLTREQRAELPGFSPTPVVRMLIPDQEEFVFTDVIRGQISAPRPDDQVILKADGFPTYHLAVVVDDHLMGITHVVRGEEWISSTPKHSLLYRWLGWEEPAWCHMPLLRNPDRSKISKRKNPAARLLWFKEQGYLPEALRNFLQLMGYPPASDDAEVCSFEEFVAGFDWARVNTVGPVFDAKKLDWLNGHYIRSLSDEELAHRLVAYIEAYQSDDLPSGNASTIDWRVRLRQAVPLISPRLTLLSEALGKIQYLLADDVHVPIDPVSEAKAGADAPAVLAATLEVVESLDEFTTQALHEALTVRLVDQMGLSKKAAFAPIRVAITGALVSPPLFESMEILGQDSCVT